MKNLHKNIGIFATSLLVTASAVYIYSPVIGSHADSSATAEISVNVADVMALSLDTNELNLSSNPNNFVSGKINATVSTNSQYGYTLTLEDVDANTSMTHANENISDTITSSFSGTKTSSEMEANTWGFSLNETDFSKVPANGSPVALKQTTSPMTEASETTPVDFGIKLGNITSGTYSDSVLFTMYTNGQDIPGPNGGGDPNDWCEFQLDGICWSGSNMTDDTYSSYNDEYGGYYTWAQADAVCANYTGLNQPAGTWRLPTDAEWVKLFNAYGTGAALADSPLAIPFGGWWTEGFDGFANLGEVAYYWTSSNSVAGNGTITSHHNLTHYWANYTRDINIIGTPANDAVRTPVRCVADLGTNTSDSVQLEVNGLHWTKDNAATGDYSHYSDTYGGYYNLAQANTFCDTYTGDGQPAGTWRLPTMEEWQTVTNRDTYDTRTELSQSPLALKNGGYYLNGAFRKQGSVINYWTSTENSATVYRNLTNSNNDAVAYMYDSTTTESSVRCVRDK
jgi:uncharacterized protein (TIGR02145 family)